MKSALSVSGCRMYLSPEIGNLVTSLIYYPKPKLCLDSSLIKPKFFSFVLSIPSKFIVYFSKKYKSLLWPLLRSHFYETSVHTN